MFKAFQSIPFSRLRSQFQSSVTSFSSSSSEKITATPSTQFMVDYLIDSLGFNHDEAISVSSKVSHLESTANSDSVVNVFKDYGLDDVQIRHIVSVSPTILTIKPSKTLEPVLTVFRELGLPGSDLVRLVKKNPSIFWRGLHTQIIPTVGYLRKLLRCDEKVVQMINGSKSMLLSTQSIRRISRNISLLQKFGLPDDKIEKFMVYNPNHMRQPPEFVERKLHYVEGKLGISCNSMNFIYGLTAVIHCSESKIDKKLQVFRNFGWSELEIATLIRSQPNCLNKSEAYIIDKLNFFMKELKYTPFYLMGCTTFWTLSLDKRLRPRNEVLKILKDKGLVKNKPSFITVVKYSDTKFLGFLRRFESHVPNLCETYLNSARNSIAE